MSTSWPQHAIMTGDYGDQWILSAISTLALHPMLLANVTPDNQNFTTNYAGIFRFNFWQNGKWVEVVIDDRLPTYNGRLMYIQNPQNQDFWAALFEKAYAKLYESYEALVGITICEALEDFTGGIIEIFTSNPEINFKSIQENVIKSYERNSLIVCCKTENSQTATGIVCKRGYLVTKMVEVEALSVEKPEKTMMVRLRYPYGITDQYRGPFNQQSNEWFMLNYKIKSKLDINDKLIEFWIPFQDLLENFSQIEICNLHPELVFETYINPDPKKWGVRHFDSKWSIGESAGGCRDCLQRFCKNPQFIIDINTNIELATVIIGLTQKYRNDHNGTRCRYIGYIVYELSEIYGNQLLSNDFLKINVSIARSPAFVNTKEITNRFMFPSGKYVIIPSTFEPDLDGEFFLRIYTDAEITDCTPRHNDLPSSPAHHGYYEGHEMQSLSSGAGCNDSSTNIVSLSDKLKSVFLQKYSSIAMIKPSELKAILDEELFECKVRVIKF